MLQRGPRRLGTIVLTALLMVGLAGCGESSAIEGDQEPPNQVAVQPTATLIVASQCSYDANGDGWMMQDELLKAMECVIPLYTWPDEQCPDAATVFATMNIPTDGVSRFQTGMEHNQIGGQNTCAWIRYWVVMTDAGNTAEANRALTFLRDDVPRYPETIPGYPPDLLDASVTASLAEEVRQAELGNTAPLRASDETSCGALTLDYHANVALPSISRRN